MSIQGRVKKPLPEHYQSWEKMLAWVNDTTRDIVRTLTHHIIELGNVKHKTLGRDYAFYKGEPRPIYRFVGLRLSKKKVSVRIRVNPTTFKDPKKWTGDKEYTRWYFHHPKKWQGQEREFKVTDKEQIDYAMELIKHSYDISGETKEGESLYIR